MRQHWRAIVLSALLALFNLLPYRTAHPHGASDLITAYSHVIQARMALQEGQFPVRVAPWEWAGTRYPVFQFYSPLVYTVLGGVDLLIHDPWWSIRVCLWVALFAAGIGAYRFGRAIDDTERTGLLCTALYLLMPYLAVNIQARGALAELFGQTLLPWCGLALWRLSTKPSVRACAWFAIAAAALIQTHLITAMYFLLTAGFALIVYAALSRRIGWLPWFAGGCVLAFGLSAWFLLPVATTSNYLVASTQTANPYDWSWLTPLKTLLSPISTSPVKGGVSGAPGLHPAVGWAALAAFLLLGRRALTERCAHFVSLSIAIAVVLFLAWTPFNFWLLLPRILFMAQFPYRLLAQSAWLAIPALVWGLQPYRALLTWRFIFVATALAMLLDITFLVRRTPEINLAYLNEAPTLGYGRSMYLPRLFDASTIYLNATPLPLADPDGVFRLNTWFAMDGRSLTWQPDVTLHLALEADGVSLPTVLSVVVAGKVAGQFPIATSPLFLDIPLARIMPAGGESIAFTLQGSRVLPGNPRHRGLRLHWAEFLNAAAPAELASMTDHFCLVERGHLRCQFKDAKAGWKQLPLLYYPSLLRAKVDGEDVEYRGSPWEMDTHITPLTAVKIPNGTHTVEAWFRGSVSADAISLAVVVGLGLIALTGRASRTARSGRQVQHTSP